MREAIILGQFISKLRKKMGMTQAQLADKLNVTVQAVSKWEKGKGLPDINTLEPLAEALNISIVELMKAERILTDEQPKEDVKSSIKNAFSFGTEYQKMKLRVFVWRGLLGIVLALFCIWFGSQVYGYHHPWIKIVYATASGEECYRTAPHIVIQEKSVWGCSLEYRTMLKEWSSQIDEIELYLSREYEKPLSIVCNVYVKEGKTILKYDGFGKTHEGEMVTIHEEIVFDFVITDNIE